MSPFSIMSRVQSVRGTAVPLFLFVFFVSLFGPLAAHAQGVASQSGRSVRMAEQAFSRGAPVPVWVDRLTALPPAPAGSSASARLMDIQFRVDAASTVYAHRALVANDSSGLGTLGQYEVEFQPEYQQLALHTLRIVRAGAVIDKLAGADIRFLQRETSLDQGIYSGSVTAAIVTEDVRVGDTLEMEYSIIGQNPVFGGKFFNSAQWDSQLPVALRRVSIDMPETRMIHVRMIGGERASEPPVSSMNRDGRRIVRYQAKSLAPKVVESYVPADVAAFRYLQFSEFDNWRDVNQWAVGLFASGDAGAAFKDALAPARAAPSKEAAVAKVLEFVQNDIRYLSISLGENSHRPFPPGQVLQRRYGDCKDKSLLMVSMLRELGIEAAPVLVSTGQRKGLDKMLPSPLLFDHAIVRAVVGGKEYYLDPTRQGQYGALDKMGQTHAGAQGLTIASGTAALATIGPVPDVERILSSRLERVTVSALDKPVEMLVRRSYASIGAEYMRLQLAGMNKEQIRKAYDGVLGDRYPESSMVGEPVIRDDRANNRLVVESTYKIANFFEEGAQGWQLRYVPTNLTELFYVPGNAVREHPFVIPHGPGLAEYELQVELPDSFNANYDDATDRYQSAAFSVTESLSFKGRTAKARTQLRLNADRVAPNGVVEFLAGMKKYNSALNGGMFIRKSDLKTAVVQAPPKKSLKEQLEANLASTTRLIDHADQAGQDASEPLCERGLLRAWLGQEAGAIADGTRVVKLRAQSGDTWKCRGDIHFVAGKFQEGESDFGRAIARGNDDVASWLGKGLSSFYLGKSASARADLGHASDKAADQPTRQQVAVWLAIVGWQPSAAPSAVGEDQPQGWRQAALAMFAQGQSPDHMLRLASRDAGAGIDVRLAEAYFYAGKYYQLKQDKMRARVYFRQALDKGALDNLYHTVARHELARLMK